MKAITVYQPWATLLVAGEKKIETRSWKTSYRGLLAIQAGRKFSADMRSLCAVEPFYTALRRAGITGPDGLPLGAIVGVVRLMECEPTEAIELVGDEGSFGDYRPGRWGWMCEEAKQLVRPVARDT